jgi:hypothetical protein
MNYIYVNNIKLIPKVITFDKNELHFALQLLKKEGNNKNNVYIVKTYKTLNLSIIFYKNNSFYRINDNSGIDNFNHVPDIDFIQQFEKDKINLLDSDMVQLNETIYTPNVNILEPCDGHGALEGGGHGALEGDGHGALEGGGHGALEGGGHGALEGGGHGALEGGGHGAVDEKNIIKNKLKEECEKVIELYTIQKDRVNKLNRDILMMEKREKKLIHDIYDKKFNLLSILHTDLKVYEQIQEQDVKDIPVLFCKKYEYFKNANENDIKIFDCIKAIDINKLLDEGINEETVSKYKLNDLFTISNKYSNDLKKLNVIFEHSWSELEDDLAD